jgi:hypothetical protein
MVKAKLMDKINTGLPGKFLFLSARKTGGRGKIRDG